MSDFDTLVVRFSSLGDVVLASSITGELGRVAFLTHRRYASLVERFSGVEAVISPEEGEGWWSLRARLPRATRVVDLHASLRSRLVLAGRGASRLERLDGARRLRVAAKLSTPIPTVLSRYAAAAGVSPSPRPWILLPEAPRAALALVPGASHATKAWPLERFQELASAWDGPVLALGGPGEEALVQAVAGANPRGEAVLERGFERTLAALGRARALVAGDTGLLHLAAASGVPVLGLFGPTTPADGFWDHPGETAEIPLYCRPCSRFGGQRCAFGDHQCMQGLSVAQVRQALERLLGRR